MQLLFLHQHWIIRPLKKLAKIKIPSIICEKPLINSKNQMNEIKNLSNKDKLYTYNILATIFRRKKKLLKKDWKN